MGGPPARDVSAHRRAWWAAPGPGRGWARPPRTTRMTPTWPVAAPHAPGVTGRGFHRGHPPRRPERGATPRLTSPTRVSSRVRGQRSRTVLPQRWGERSPRRL